MHEFLAAFERYKEEAQRAYEIFLSYYLNAPRVPGCSTVIRLAWRIKHGATIEESAAREYVYRWELAVKPGDQCLTTTVRNPCVSVFGTPHTIGM